MKILQRSLLTISVIAGLIGTGALLFPDVAAASPASEVTSGVNATGTGGASLETQLKTIVNVLLFVIGAIAVIVIVIGGLKYILSDGDSSKIKGAKDTILYAVIGLVVALLAFAIVNFVVGQF